MKEINDIIQGLIQEHGEWVTLSKACEVLGTPKVEIESWGVETHKAGYGQTLYSLAELFQTAIAKEPEEPQPPKPRVYTPREKPVPAMPREERDAKILAQYDIFVDRAFQLWQNKHQEWCSGSPELERLWERKMKAVRAVQQRVQIEEAKVAPSMVELGS